ncbi:MAG TPA: hypothetical protein VFC44_15395 [Candidatus Saccharimonadales bacterium]|nr:hypothetical protein [Candidatus Saccharimonadales bacterium]
MKGSLSFGKIKTSLVLLLAVFVLAREGWAESVVVTVDPNAAGAEISPDFIGVSYEMSAILPDRNGRYFFSADNKPLLETFRALGIKSLRVGGNTADRPSIKVPGEADIDSLFAFARAAGVKVLYTLRLNEGEPKTIAPGPSKAGSKETLKPYDPKADARIANYILDHYAANLACFIIGNEPDHYYADFPSYRQAWEKFAGEITSPAALFCGPSTTPSRVAWAGDFARELGHGHRVAFITQHEYPAGSGRITDVDAARAKLLSPRIEAVYQKFYDAFAPAVLEAGQHFRLEECNSFSNGGARGVSDAFAASLWGVDYMYWWAAHGASGLNFHTSGANSTMRYAVFAAKPEGCDVHALGYALKAFDLGCHGRLVAASVNPPEPKLKAWVVRGAKALFVTLINKDYSAGATALQVTLNAGASSLTGQTMLLSAASDGVEATTGITLGGASIRDDGSWNGQWSPLTPQAGSGHWVVALPPASIVVVKLAACRA